MITADKQNGLIFDIKRFSLHDGPGIRTTIFFKGCPLSCVWCQNPESISCKPQILFYPSRCLHCGACVAVCPNNKLDASNCKLCGACTEACYSQARVIAGKSISLQQLLKTIEKDKVFYNESNGGVTFSGGEPMQQIDFLREVLKYCSANNINTAVDTSGYTEWANFESILNLTNLFLFDIKHLNNSIHKKYTGVENTLILNNLKKLADSETNIVIRIPLVDGFNDNTAYFKQVAEFIYNLPGTQRVEILACHNFAEAKYLAMNKQMQYLKPNERKLEEFKKILGSVGILEGEIEV